MKCSNISERLIKKAATSQCHYKVAAIGIDFRGKVIACKNNRPRFSKEGGGLHAEMNLMRKAPKSLRFIIICRVSGDSNRLRHIDPCKVCLAEANRRGITISTLK